MIICCVLFFLFWGIHFRFVSTHIALAFGWGAGSSLQLQGAQRRIRGPKQRWVVVDLMVTCGRKIKVGGWIQCLRGWWLTNFTLQPLQICMYFHVFWVKHSDITWAHAKNDREFFLQKFARPLKSWPTWCLDCRNEPPWAYMWDERPWDRLDKQTDTTIDSWKAKYYVCVPSCIQRYIIWNCTAISIPVGIARPTAEIFKLVIESKPQRPLAECPYAKVFKCGQKQTQGCLHHRLHWFAWGEQMKASITALSKRIAAVEETPGLNS